jgi:hypothetical protein
MSHASFAFSRPHKEWWLTIGCESLAYTNHSSHSPTSPNQVLTPPINGGCEPYILIRWGWGGGGMVHVVFTFFAAHTLKEEVVVVVVVVLLL